MRKLLSYLKPYRGRIALAAVLMAVSAVCNLLLPTLMSNVLDKGVYGAAEADTFGYILKTGAWMLGISLLSLGSVAGGYWVVYHVISGYTWSLRSALFRQVHSMTLAEVGRIGASNLVTRSTHDVGTLNWVISMLCGSIITIPLMFLGGTLQMDYYGNSSTVTKTRIAGFGGAPNMGSNPQGRRHITPAWHSMITDPTDPMAKGRKLVTQIIRTQVKNKKTGEMTDCIVPELDAVGTAKKAGISEPMVMIHGEDVTHVVSEIGIAYTYMAKNKEERKELIAAIAGKTKLGQSISPERIAELRKEGKVAYPEDLGIDPATATRDRLSAQTLDDIVEWSHGLYKIPDKFKAEA